MMEPTGSSLLLLHSPELLTTPLPIYDLASVDE
jgi:hypothetical protein